MFEGLNYSFLEDTLKKKGDFIYGEAIKPHTKKKINYISEYVDKWLYVVASFSNEIYFIDVMSNAGLYKNQQLTTSIEVLNIICRHASRNPDKKFYLLCNDIDQSKISTLNMIFAQYRDCFCQNGLNNIFLESCCSDAVYFIQKNLNNRFYKRMHGIMKTILLYVDPYNLITKELSEAIHYFVKHNYAEVIINFDINDLNRNLDNPTTINKQKDITVLLNDFCGIKKDRNNPNAILDSFLNRFTFETNVKFTYSVKIMNSRNAPLYYLLFLTPNLRGLEKVKDATWSVFSFHTAYSSSIRDEDYPDLFGKTDEDYAFENCLEEMKQELLMSHKTLFTYEDILIIALCKTFAKKGHVISRIIKPLIDSGFLLKCGVTKSSNFTGDKYKILGGKQ